MRTTAGGGTRTLTERLLTPPPLPLGYSGEGSTSDQCRGWDSNPHYPHSECGASCRLGYHGSNSCQLPVASCQLPVASCQLPVPQAGFEPATSGISGRRLLPIGLLRLDRTKDGFPRVPRPCRPCAESSGAANTAVAHSTNTNATFSGGGRNRTCKGPFDPPRFSRPVPAPMGSAPPLQCNSIIYNHFTASNASKANAFIPAEAARFERARPMWPGRLANGFPAPVGTELP